MQRAIQSIKNRIGSNCNGPKYLHIHMYENLIIIVTQVLGLGRYKQSR